MCVLTLCVFGCGLGYSKPGVLSNEKKRTEVGGSREREVAVDLEDRAVAVMHTLAISKSTLRSMESDYYIMPMPKYDETQPDYRSFINAWSNAFIGIPITSDPGFSGNVTEALCWHSYKNLRADMYNLLLKEKSARDAGSQRMIDILLGAQYIDFNGLYDFGGTTSVLQKALYGKGELISGLEKVAEKAQKAIDTLQSEWTGE